MYPALNQSPQPVTKKFRGPAQHFEASAVDGRMQRKYLKDRINGTVSKAMLPAHREALEDQLELRFGTRNKVRQDLLADKVGFVKIDTPLVSNPSKAVVRALCLIGSHDTPTTEMFDEALLSESLLPGLFAAEVEKLHLPVKNVEYLALTFSKAGHLTGINNLTLNLAARTEAQPESATEISGGSIGR